MTPQGGMVDLVQKIGQQLVMHGEIVMVLHTDRDAELGRPNRAFAQRVGGEPPCGVERMVRTVVRGEHAHQGGAEFRGEPRQLADIKNLHLAKRYFGTLAADRELRVTRQAGDLQPRSSSRCFSCRVSAGE